MIIVNRISSRRENHPHFQKLYFHDTSRLFRLTGFKNIKYFCNAPIDFRNALVQVLGIMRVRRKQNPKYIDLIRLRADYGISETKAKRMIADGRIKVIHLVDEGRCRDRMLIVVDELERYLKSLEVMEPPRPKKPEMAG